MNNKWEAHAGITIKCYNEQDQKLFKHWYTLFIRSNVEIFKKSQLKKNAGVKEIRRLINQLWSRWTKYVAMVNSALKKDAIPKNALMLYLFFNEYLAYKNIVYVRPDLTLLDIEIDNAQKEAEAINAVSSSSEKGSTELQASEVSSGVQPALEEHGNFGNSSESKQNAPDAVEVYGESESNTSAETSR